MRRQLPDQSPFIDLLAESGTQHIGDLEAASVRSHGLNPKSETLRIDALCIEWRGNNGEEGKVASSHRGVQAPGRRTDEDLRKHWGFGPRVQVRAEAPLHLEVPVRGPARTPAREFGNYRRRPQRETTSR